MVKSLDPSHKLAQIQKSNSYEQVFTLIYMFSHVTGLVIKLWPQEGSRTLIYKVQELLNYNGLTCDLTCILYFFVNLKFYKDFVEAFISIILINSCFNYSI